jgi:hypothetical protein
MVRALMVVLPAAKIAKLPLEKVVGEALNAEVVDQYEETLWSQVPLVAGDAALLSHHIWVCALAWYARRENERPRAAGMDRSELGVRFFIILVGLSDFPAAAWF